MTSREAICILNPGDETAHIEILVFHESKDPVGPCRFNVEPRRTRHLLFNNFEDPEPIPATPRSSA